MNDDEVPEGELTVQDLTLKLGVWGLMATVTLHRWDIRGPRYGDIIRWCVRISENKPPEIPRDILSWAANT